MAKPAQPRGLPLLSLAILAGLLALAADSMHRQLHRNNLAELVAPLLDPSDTRVRKRFTGLEGLDGFLTKILILFMPVFTGEMPELTLFAFYFSGQMVAAVVFLTVQGLRQGTRRSPARFATLWAIVMQAAGYGVVMPLYGLLDLVFSSSGPGSSGLTDPARLHAIVPAVGLGFVLPSILQALPLGQDLHQKLLAVWQAFPIYVGYLLWMFSQVIKRTVPTVTNKKKSAVDKEALDHAYGFAISVGAVTHWATMGVIAAATFSPGLFPAGVADSFTFAKVFVPHPPRWYGTVTIASTMMQFLHYDLHIGAGATLVWAATQANRAGVWSLDFGGIARIARDVLVLGPVTAAVSLLRSRDEAVLGS